MLLDMRQSNHEDGDDILKNAFENQSLPPLPDLWPNISDALDEVTAADSVKNAFEAQAVPLLPDLWGGISDALDEVAAADSVKNAFEAQAVPLLPDLWDGISEHLQTANELPPYNAISNAFHDHFLVQASMPSHQKNIEKAWANIQPELPRAKSNYRRLAALAVLLLLLRQCGELVQIPSNFNPNDSHLAQVKTNPNTFQNTAPNNSNNSNTKNTANLVQQPVSNNIKPLAHKANSTQKNNNSKPQNQVKTNTSAPDNSNTNVVNPILVNITENPTVIAAAPNTNTLIWVPNPTHNAPKTTNEGHTLPSHANMLFAQFNEQAPEAPEAAKKSPDESKTEANFNRFQIGIGSEITTALFWNQDSQDALSKTSFASLDLLPRLNLFVQFKFQIAPRHALAFNLHPNSVSQQQFGEFSSSGIYLRKETKLQYTRYSAQYQYQWRADDISRPYFGTPFAAASIQFGHLIRSQETINDLPQNTTFKKNQYNLGIGLGYQIRYQRLLFSCGLHASLSLHNIAHGSQTSLIQAAPFAMLHYGF